MITGKGMILQAKWGLFIAMFWITRGYCQVGPQVVGQVGKPFKTRLSIRFMVKIYIYVCIYAYIINYVLRY